MTTRSDDPSRMDQAAAAETPGARDDTARVTKSKKGARSNAAAAPHVTQELPAVDLEPTPSAPGGEDDDGATREVTAVSSGALTLAPQQPSASATDMPALPRYGAAHASDASDDPDATMMRPQQRSAAPGLDQPLDEPMTEPVAPRQRFNTLAGAFNRSRAAASDPAAPAGRVPTPSEPVAPPPAQPMTKSSSTRWTRARTSGRWPINQQCSGHRSRFSKCSSCGPTSCRPMIRRRGRHAPGPVLSRQSLTPRITIGARACHHGHVHHSR